MELTNLTIEELEARKSELLASLDSPEIDTEEKVAELRDQLAAVDEEMESISSVWPIISFRL